MASNKDASVAVGVAYTPLAENSTDADAAEEQAYPSWHDTAASLLWLLASLQLLAFVHCLLPSLPVALARVICGAAGVAAACGVLASVLDLCLGPASDDELSATAVNLVTLMALRDLAVLLAAGAAVAGAAWLGWLDYIASAGTATAGSSSPELQDKLFTLVIGSALHGLMSYLVL